MDEIGEKDVTPSADGVVSIEHTFQGNHIHPVICVCFSPDDSRICSVCRGGKLVCYDTTSGEMLVESTGHSRDITFVDYSPIGSLIATSSNDSDIRFWDPENIGDGSIHTINKAHSSGIYCVKFDWTGRTIYSGSKDKCIKKWDVEKRTSDMELTSGDWVNSIDVSKDNNMLVSGHAFPYSVKFWDVREKRMVHEIGKFKNIVATVKFQPTKSNLVASGDWNKKVRVFDIRTYKQLHEFHDHSNYVCSVCFHPGGNHVISGSDDKTIKLFDISSSEKFEDNNIASEVDEKNVNDRLLFSVKIHSNYVNTVSFSSSGKHFLSGSYDKTVILWKLNMGIGEQMEFSKEDEEERIKYLVEKLEIDEEDVEDEKQKNILGSSDILRIHFPLCTLKKMYAPKFLF